MATDREPVIRVVDTRVYRVTPRETKDVLAGKCDLNTIQTAVPLNIALC